MEESDADEDAQGLFELNVVYSHTSFCLRACGETSCQQQNTWPKKVNPQRRREGERDNKI